MTMKRPLFQHSSNGIGDSIQPNGIASFRPLPASAHCASALDRGGDCPGINAVIRAIVARRANYGDELWVSRDLGGVPSAAPCPSSAPCAAC